MKIYRLFTSIFTVTNVRYNSSLSQEEVISRLQSALEPEDYLNPLRSITSSKPYGGEIHGSKFGLVPHKFFFPSLTPSITGSIKFIEDKTVIDIELSSGTAALWGFGLICIMLFSLYSLFHSVLTNYDPFYLLIPCPVILIFIITNLIYLLNLNDCTKSLEELFDAQSAQPTF